MNEENQYFPEDFSVSGYQLTVTILIILRKLQFHSLL